MSTMNNEVLSETQNRTNAAISKEPLRRLAISVPDVDRVN